VTLIGERPGLSAPDSLGAYLTFAPRASAAPTPSAIAFPTSTARGSATTTPLSRIAWLIREGLAREITGVALKDESGGPTPSSA
jgi:ethanolamine ammonia-lyase small subunit